MEKCKYKSQKQKLHTLIKLCFLYYSLQKRNLARYNLGPSSSGEGGSSGQAGGAAKAAPAKSASNIHRLKDYGSDDDDSNTYNGNSTQQM